MNWRRLLAGGLVCLASWLYADTPYIPVTVNFELVSPQFEIKTKALNTPTVRVYPYQGTNLYDATAYQSHLSWGKDVNASAMVSVTGSVSAGYIDFVLSSNDLAYPVTKWYCAVMLRKPDDGKVYSIAYGYMTVLPAPEVAASGILHKTYALNGAEYGPFTGDFTNWPFALKGDYAGYVEIAAWRNTNSVFETRITGLETGRVTLAAYAIVTNALSTGKVDVATYATATNTLSTGKVDVATFNATNALKVDKSGYAIVTNALSTGKVDVATYAAATNTLSTGKVDVATYAAATNTLSTGKVDVATYAAATNTLSTGKVDVANYAIATNTLSTGKVDVAIYAIATNTLSTGKVDVATYALATNTLSTGKVDVATYALATNTLSTGKVDVATFNETNAAVISALAGKSATNHTHSEYLSTGTNLFSELYVGNRSQLGTNMAGLTQGTYTGVVGAIVAYTGVTELVAGRMYDCGFTKIGSDGTATLSIATLSLTATDAGATSNYFRFLGTDTNLILTLSGTALGICNVSNVYVRQITGGVAAVASDLSVGGDLYLGETNSVYFPDGEEVSSYSVASWNQATTDVGVLKGRTSVWEKAATDASDATNRVAVMEGSTSAWTKAVSDAADATNRVAVMEGSTSAWTKAASDGVDATNRIAIIEGSTQAWTKAVSDASDATNRVTVIEGRTSVWEQAATDVASATGDVAVLQGRTSVWDTAATDASAATNFLATNTLQSQITANATGKVSHVEHDAHTNLSLASGAHGGELDPVWGGVSNAVVYTNSVGYTATVEKAATAYGWGDHAGLYVGTNDAAYTNAVALAGTALQGATIAAGAANSVTTNAGVLSITWNTNDAAGGGEALWIAASNQVQTDLDDLQTATNALNTRMGTAETATNALNTRMGTAETATNALNTRMGTAETATNALNTRVGTLETSTNDLNSRVGTIEGVTGSVIYADGHVAMAGDFNAGGYGLTNMTNVAFAGSGEIAIGENAPQYNASVIIGQTPSVHGSGASVLCGNKAKVGQTGVAIGYLAWATNTGSIAIGSRSYATDYGVAIGWGVSNPVAGTTRIYGNLDMNSANITNAAAVYAGAAQATTGTFANLTITGGTPTNGAVWLGTNTTGGGKWSGVSWFRASRDAELGYSNAAQLKITWTVTNHNYGGNFATDTYTTPVNGIYHFQGRFAWNRVNGTALYGCIYILAGGAEVGRVYQYYGGPPGVGSVAVDSGPIYLTAGTAVSCYLLGEAGSTNKINSFAPYNMFGGGLVRELP